MKRCASWLIAWLLSVALMSASSARAESAAREQEARRLFEEGVAASDAQRWADAEQSFTRSYALVPASTTLLNLALARYQLGDAVRALRALDELDVVIAREDLRMRAQSLRSTLEPLVARYVVRLGPVRAELELDGESLPTQSEHHLVLAPGTHVLRVSAEGYEPDQRELSVAAGSMGEATITLVRSAPSPALVIPTVASVEPTSPVAQPSAPPAHVDSEPRRAGRIWRNPWLWGAVGAVVVGAGVTTGLLLRHGEDGSDYPAGADGSQHYIAKPR